MPVPALTMGGFSFASVILSYFLVGGGIFGGAVAAVMLRIESPYIALIVAASGAAFGGFVASRASHGSTILEPAIGALAVVATVVALAASTLFGQLVWVFAREQTIQSIAMLGGATAVGAILGAFVSEKLFGEPWRSSLPWVIYASLATFGASVLVALSVAVLFFRRGADEAAIPELATILLAGVGGGCLLAGLATGASARVRPLIAAFLGGGLGVAGFFYLITHAAVSISTNAAAGLAVLAGGGAIVTLVGAFLGWITVGRRHAE